MEGDPPLYMLPLDHLEMDGLLIICLSLQAMYGRMWKECCEPALPKKQESDKILPVYFLSSLITPKTEQMNRVYCRMLTISSIDCPSPS